MSEFPNPRDLSQRRILQAKALGELIHSLNTPKPEPFQLRLPYTTTIHVGQEQEIGGELRLAPLPRMGFNIQGDYVDLWDNWEGP